MKLNYDFYTGNDKYSDGDIENVILDYTERYKEGEFDEVFKNDICWPVFYHLSPIRQNVINWYPFKKDSTVLEIGAGMGAITSALCKKAKKVTCVELSKQRASCIAKRCKDYDNLEIYVANLNDVKFEEKFDYITLIGVLEYAPVYTHSTNPFKDFLDYIKTFLKEDGKLIIAIENQFGLKYFAGAPEDHTSKKYDGITGYENKNGVKTFCKPLLKNILKESGFNYTKFYYPLPDYKLPNIIFSDDYLPTENNIENYMTYYYEGTEIEFDEKKAYKETINNGVFDIFANSYIVEASNKEIDTIVNFENIKYNEISKISKRFYEKEYNKKDNYEQNQKNIKEIEDKINDLENKNTILTNNLRIIEKSFSWKLTKPLRYLSKLIRR